MVSTRCWIQRPTDKWPRTLAQIQTTMKKQLLPFLFFTLSIGANAQTGKLATSTGPVITFASPEHDYGTIPHAANGNCEFHFMNTGDQPLIITSSRTSCGCMVSRFDPAPAMPGKSGVIHVKYDTNRPGPFTKSVTVESNAANTPIVVLRIRGQVLPPPLETAPTNAHPDH